MAKIVLDPGHGGRNQNRGLNGYLEAEFTLDMAKRVKPLLEAHGHTVILTRTGDYDLDPDKTTKWNEKADLQARCDIANNAKADYFYSIHTNAHGDPKVGGTETFHWGNQPKLAAAMNQALVTHLGTRNRGVKTADFYVLKHTTMPAILLEVAFHTNEGDIKILAQRERCARAIANGILAGVGSAGGELTKIMGEAQVTKAQAEAYMEQVAPSHKFLVHAIWDIAKPYGVRPEVALALMLHETGRFKFGGDAKPDQNNWCGLGVTGTLNKYMKPHEIEAFNKCDKTFVAMLPEEHGARYPTPEHGVLATIQHLYAYATVNPLIVGFPYVDPRFSLVSRGSSPTLEGLGGKWAYPGYDKKKYGSLEEAYAAQDTYGHTIRERYLKPMLATQAPPVPPSGGSDPGTPFVVYMPDGSTLTGFKVGGTSYVPVRAFADKLGFKTTYYPEGDYARITEK